MTDRVRTRRWFPVAAAVVFGGLMIAGSSACNRRASTPPAQVVSYPPQQPLDAYRQQDPQWQHRVAVVAPAVVPGAPSSDGDLRARLDEAGFIVVALNAPPPDGGPFNTVLELDRAANHVVIDARVLAPAAQGRYEQMPAEGEAALYARVVSGLSQHLQPVPKPPAMEEEPPPPPPDPAEICRSDCQAKVEPCARACCERDLGSDVAKCDAARDAGTRCTSECEAKHPETEDPATREPALEKCLDGCRRGKHPAYPWDPSVARLGAVHMKCASACDEELSACVAACDAPAAADQTGEPEAVDAPPSE